MIARGDASADATRRAYNCGGHVLSKWYGHRRLLSVLDRVYNHSTC